MKQDWLEVIEKASRPKKGTKIPKGVDLYALMSQMEAAGRTVMAAGGPVAPQSVGVSSLSPWNTGAGANGVVEPGKAVAIDYATTPPTVLDEGEKVKPFPGGKEIVPAETEEAQASLDLAQKNLGFRRMATGGTVYDNPTSTPVTSTFDLSPVASSQSAVDQALRTTQQRASGTDPLMRNISNTALRDYDTRAAASSTETAQAVAANPNLTTGAKNAIKAKETATYRSGLSDLTAGLAQQSMTRAETANTDLYNMGRQNVQDEVSRQQWQKTFDTSNQQWQKEFDRVSQQYGDQQFARMADDAQTTSLQTWLVKYPNATEADYNTAREYKTKQLEAAGIANATASETLTQMKNSAAWDQAQKFLEAGDYANYAAIVKQTTGRDISTADFVEDRKYLETTRTQATTAADLANEAAATANQTARNRLGDEQFASVQNAINSGASWQNVNEMLAQQGNGQLSWDEYNAMVGASAIGERNWNRQMSLVTTLLSTPGAANKEEAAKQLYQMFPGIDLDVSALVASEKSDNFAAGMSDLAKYINAGMDERAALTALGSSGVLQQMGVTPEVASKLYNAMNVNAVDSEWKEMVDSDFWKSLTPTEQAEQQEFFKQKMLGSLEVEALHEYTIADPSNPNKTTTIWTDSQASADAEAKKLGAGYAATDTGKIKFQTKDNSTTTTETTVDYTPEQWSAGTVPIADKWSYFQKNNALYPDITTEQEWKDAGMPHPYEKVAEQITSKLPSTITKASDMHLPDSSKEVNAKFDSLYTKMQNGDTTDAFSSDDMDNYLPAWVELNAGTPIKIGDTSYKVKSYSTADKAGDRSKLVLEDSKGVEYVIEGDVSKAQTSAQMKAQNNKEFIGNAFALEIPQLVGAIKTGDAGEIALGVGNLLTGGWLKWIRNRAKA